MTYLSSIRQNKFLQATASLRITVVCLSLLFILTLWGTVDQAYNGLYLAQERFFHSFVFLLWGFIPFPGAQLVMWCLFFNLISALVTRFVYRWSHIGLLMIHCGLILFLVSGYITLYGAKESHLTLTEGQAANVSVSFDQWEVAFWTDETLDINGRLGRTITAIDSLDLKQHQPILLERFGWSITLKDHFRHAAAYIDPEGASFLNAAKLNRLSPLALEKEPEKNVPGIIFDLKAPNEEPVSVLLYGAEPQPTPITIGDQTVYAFLRPKRYPMPFTIMLIDFIKEEHPGTTMARAFKSLVAIETQGASREKLISMNNPLRNKSFTFYQASYSMDEFQRARSTLAVVDNDHRLFPYIATGVTFLGLLTHFSLAAWRSRKPSAKQKKIL